MHDKDWMEEAYLLAKKSFAIGEVPVGSVIINDEGKLVGCGFNQIVTNHDPTAHAEIAAIRQAAQKVQNYRLEGATLYTTLEPCCMCAGAIVHSRIKRLIFATRDLKSGAAGSVYNLMGGFPLNHKVQIDEGILQEKSAKLLEDFFRIRRI